VREGFMLAALRVEKTHVAAGIHIEGLEGFAVVKTARKSLRPPSSSLLVK
jgi:hypothetical protein